MSGPAFLQPAQILESFKTVFLTTRDTLVVVYVVRMGFPKSQGLGFRAPFQSHQERIC